MYSMRRLSAVFINCACVSSSLFMRSACKRHVFVSSVLSGKYKLNSSKCGPILQILEKCYSTRALPDEKNKDVEFPNEFLEIRISDERASLALANLNPDEEKRLRVLKLELDVMYSTGDLVPNVVTDKMWLYVLKKCKSLGSRRKYFKYKALDERRKQRSKEKQEIRRIKHAERLEEITANPRSELYGPKNTFMLFIREQTMSRHHSSELAYAMQFGQTICFDFDFESSMAEREIRNLAEQMSRCHGFNKKAVEPFHFHLCNLRKHSVSYDYLLKFLPNLEDIPMTVSEDSYLDHYNPRDIVYLSPQGKTVMKKFDPSKVYIVGGIVDRAQQPPLTSAKAKRESIEYVKLPLDEHFSWKLGRKSLTVDQVLRILLDLNEHGDWDTALRHVPRRKVST